MDGLTRFSGKETEPKTARIELKEMKGFPESIQELFQAVPKSVQERIISEIKREPTESFEDNKKSLEEMVASFDPETREKFMEHCLGELFYVAEFRERIETFFQEGDIKQEITRLLDVLWKNREKKKEEVTLFNEPYYHCFEEERRIVLEKIEEKKSEEEKQKLSLSKTEGQRRLTETKRKQLHQLQDELTSFIKERENLDFRYHNWIGYGKGGISWRQRKEKEWTEGIALVTQYVDPTEFATAIGEQLDRTFAQIKRIVETKKVYGRPGSAEAIERASRISSSIDEAIQRWAEVHETEGSLKSHSEAKSEERMEKVLMYVRSLMESYQKFRKEGKSDEDLIYTIRQIEISLRLLGK